MAYRRRFRKYRKARRARGPKRYRRRFARKGRRFRKSKYGGGSLGVLRKGPRLVKLKYVNTATFDPKPVMTGDLKVSGNDHIYRCNNVLDPQYASSGGTAFNQTAAGFRFWSQLYDHYEVIKSRCKITYRQCTPCTNTLMQPLITGVRIDDDTSISSYTSWEQFVGDPNTKFRTLQFTTDPGNSKPVTIVSWWRRKYGSGDNNVAAVTGPPPDEEYFVPWYQPSAKRSYTLESGIPLLSYQTTITYWVKFSEPRDLGGLSSLVQN